MLLHDSCYVPTEQEFAARVAEIRDGWDALTRRKRDAYPAPHWTPPTVSLPREVLEAMEADNGR